jgi:hypothetical protein
VVRKGCLHICSKTVNTEKELILLKMQETGESPVISMAELGTERRHFSELMDKNKVSGDGATGISQKL